MRVWKKLLIFQLTTKESQHICITLEVPLSLGTVVWKYSLNFEITSEILNSKCPLRLFQINFCVFKLKLISLIF